MASTFSGSSGGPKKDLSSFLSPNKKFICQVKAKDIQLQKELKSLAKANEVDVRSQQAKELQFRIKYNKYLTTGNFETSLLKKEAFKQFQRNRESTTSNVGIIPEEHIPLYKLIYTNGEVDIEKVVCLNLLTVQYFDILSRVDAKSLSLFPKRSKPNVLEASSLPFYIVHIIHRVNTETKLELKEGQDVVIVVNSNVEKLIIAILEVLAIVSPQKLLDIVKLSHSKKGIQEIMIKTKIHNFLAHVKECAALFITENYRLEIAQFQPEPSLDPNILSLSRVRVKDRSGKLEMIQKEIQAIITKYCETKNNSGESWSMYHKKFCSCRKSSSKNSMSLGKGISLLHDDGREFALVTMSGCHLPTGSSAYCPSLTAIIKSSPNQRGYNINESSSFLLNQRGFPLLKNEQRKLMTSLLYKVNNSHRILIGKKVAEMDSQNVINNKPVKKKIPINKIMEEVFTKESLISFASTTENEELKLMFQPCCKGGLGIGSFILQSEKVNINSNKTLLSTQSSAKVCSYQEETCPQIMEQEKSIMNTAIIKQDIFTSETRTKMKQFLLSENPGPKNINGILYRNFN